MRRKQPSVANDDSGSGHMERKRTTMMGDGPDSSGDDSDNLLTEFAHTVVIQSSSESESGSEQLPSSSDGHESLGAADGWGAEAAADSKRAAADEICLPCNMYAVAELVDCVEVMGCKAYLVVWEGYPMCFASWELEEHITPDLLVEYRARRMGSSTTRLEPMRAAFRQHDFELEPSHAEERDLEAIECGTFKYKQKGTPLGGYLRRTKGVLMAILNCNIIVDFTECYGSESISQVVFFLLQLFSQSETLLGELVALMYDVSRVYGYCV